MQGSESILLEFPTIYSVFAEAWSSEKTEFCKTMPLIIVVLSEKSGVGKSSTARFIAREYSVNDRSVQSGVSAT